jgi:phosphonate transport system permease protein
MREVSRLSSGASVSLPITSSGWLTLRRLVWAAIMMGALAVSWHAAEVDLGSLFSAETAQATWRFLAGLFPPDLSASFLRTVVRALLQTMATAVAATLLSIVVGLPAAVLASGKLWRHGILTEAYRRSPGYALLAIASKSARVFLGFARAVPDLLWAILFVTMVGLGSLAGTLALSVAYSGVIGQVYSDLFDTINPQPLEALQSTGASRLQIFLRGIWPQAAPVLISYTLYSFECCVRAASVLGLVGAGGIGYEVGISMRLFEYGQVLTLIMALIALLALTDAASRFLRKRMARRAFGARATPDAGSGTHQPVGPRPPAIMAFLRTLALATGIVAAFYYAGFTPEGLDQQNVLQHATRFIASMIPPDVEGKFLAAMSYLTLQTLAISYIGTLIGVAFGSVLALPSTASLVFLNADATGRHGIGERVLRWLVFWLARLLLNLMRAIPELVWVLVCILAIGIGPFAGAIAIGLHTGGVLGKLYAEVMEEVPRAPVEALYALGASPLQVLLRAVWPQAKAMLLNYTLLRWEANLRVSTILGLVGGGGLGQAIYNNIQLGFHQRVATMILLIYALVIVSDWAGDHLRGYRGQRARDLLASQA